MKRVKEFFKKFVREEEGASATEYAVLIVLIIVVALTAIGLLGEQVDDGFDRVATAIRDAAASAN